MQTLTERNQIISYPETPLRDHLLRYYDLLYEDQMGPVFVVGKLGDNIVGPDYAFVGSRGLLSDLFDEHQPGHPDFSRPYEWVSHLPELQLYETLLLLNNEDGYWIIIPEAIVETRSDLRSVLTSEEQGGLSPPQPL